MRQVGGALGVAVLGSVLSAQYRDQITPHLSGLPARVQDAAGESIGATVTAAAKAGPQAVAQIQQPAFDAFIHAMHVTVTLASFVALLATLLAFRFMPSMRPAAEVPSQVSREPQEAVEAVPGN
jgi:DHA2 family integral membrane protein (MFS transporter)